MGVPAGRLYDVARAVLDSVVDHYADEDVDLPARRFVSDGRPATDCEQLVAYVERVSVGIVGQVALEPANCLHQRHAVVAVRLLRCTANVMTGPAGAPRFPAPAVIDAAAEAVLRDAVMVENAVLAAYRAGDLGDLYGVAFEDWTAIRPEGGFSGGELRVRVALTVAMPGGE